MSTSTSAAGVPAQDVHDVTARVREGDRVAYSYFYPCGRCYVCLNGDSAACPAKIAPGVPRAISAISAIIACQAPASSYINRFVCT